MMTVLQDLSNNLAETVAAIGTSIVRVEARRRLPASGVVWSTDGLIVTANHIVQRDEKIKVGLADGQTIAANLVGRDPTTDLAVLRAETSGLTPPTWASNGSDALGVGHFVLALGRPGKTVQATLGIISAVSQDEWHTPAGGVLHRYLQTDVVMYPGFSGGALVNATGQILGINSSALLRGVSLTAPSQTVGRVIEALLTHGHIRRGYLGVSTQPVRLPEALQTTLQQETGLLLASVDEEGPAGEGRLLLGDTIVAFAGKPITTYDDLVAALSPDRVGQSVTLKIVRGGQVQEVDVVIGTRE